MNWILLFTVLVTSLTAIAFAETPVLVLEELKSISYEVDILKTPVKDSDEMPPSAMKIKSKFGQMYQCILPEVDDGVDQKKAEKIKRKKEELDIQELLKPIKMGSCLLKTKDWWTYEFCFGHYVKQYHIEDGKIIGQVLTLGMYESDFDWQNETEAVKLNHKKQRYHYQIYSNGTKCDLTGEPRTAEVRFFCEEDAGDYIYRIDEPGTCNYILTVHTSRLCADPRLKPVPSNKSHVISCYPLLTDEQYVKYMQKLEEEKSMAESNRNKWLTTQEDQLKVIKDSPDKPKSKREPPFKTFPKEKKQEAEILDGFESILANKPNADPEMEKVLLHDYDREIENLKSVIPPDQFAAVKSSIEKHIDTLINDAEEQMDVSRNEESRKVIYTKLASTLNSLLDRLDKANEDVARVAQHWRKTSIYNSDVTDDDLVSKSKNNVDNNEEDDNRPEQTLMEALHSDLEDESGKLKLTENDPAESSISDDKLHVRIRRLDRKSPDATGELHEMDFAQRTKLERAIKEKLEKSGVDTGGRRIEVKIITPGYYDNEDGKDFHALSDEETMQFQNMIMALLTGQQEAVQEMERHKKLEENYKHVWDFKLKDDSPNTNHKKRGKVYDDEVEVEEEVIDV